jgi:DNA-binding transcriptional regulator LsrR (DeoR family)
VSTRSVSTAEALGLQTYMTTEEVAKIMRCARYTVQRKCRQAQLAGAVKISNDRWLIPASTVAELLGVDA